MWTAIVVLGIFAFMVALHYRGTPETRTKAECLRSTGRLRNELANLIGTVGALFLLFALAISSSVLTYIGGMVVGLAFLTGWSADRRERAAEALEHRRGY